MRAVGLVLLSALLVAGSAGGDSFELESGDVLSGDVVEERDDAIVIDHPTLGRIEIPRDQIVPPEPPVPPNPGLFGTSFLEGFTRTFGVGIAGSQGKTDEATVNLRLKIDKEDEAARRMFNSRYYYSSKESEATANELFVEYGHDFLFSESSWFLFVRARYDYDEFEVWNHRVGGSGGVGYDILKNETWEILGRLGGGVTHTWQGLTETRPEGQVGLDAKWNLSDNDNLSVTNNYFPDFENTSDFRFVTLLAWNVALDYLEGLGFTTGVENEYDSRRIDKNNLKYFLNLTYDF